MFIALWGSQFVGHRRWAIGRAPVENEGRLRAFSSSSNVEECAHDNIVPAFSA
jgi:hypothetical protein